MDMKSFKLGLCSVTFRKKSIEEVVETARKAGVGYIEWGGDIHVKSVEDACKVKSLCDNYPKCDFSVWDMPTGEKCPECGALMLEKKGKKQHYCMNEACGYKKDAE